MKLRTRLIVAFLIVIIIPLLLSGGAIRILLHVQSGMIERSYGVSGTEAENLTNSIQVLVQMTEESYQELNELIESDPGQMEDVTCLEDFNRGLKSDDAYLLVRKNDHLIFMGEDEEDISQVIEELPGYDSESSRENTLIYLAGDGHSLVRQTDFLYPDGGEGSAFIVRDTRQIIPEVAQLLTRILASIVVILIITAILMIFWIYRGIMKPLTEVEMAANKIKEGNLDFELHPTTHDEIGELEESLEEMRKRLKDNAVEKVEFDQENKDLISNISHDLKTPVTTIKGYAEGIMDGVADTPDKMNKYVQTIYGKADEMDQLINELTMYANLDTNRIPYNFSIVSANDYFNDCAEDLSSEMESKNVDFGYFNYVGEEVQIIADPEEIKRVIHNIINNSLKYMDKEKPMINLRVKDVGDFIQVEVEDNGCGIAAKDLPNIFDRFYRTDTSRNSSRGGSGIGLSVVKKIIEEHGGKVWVTSREGNGTTMYFVLRKYQEVPVDE